MNPTTSSLAVPADPDSGATFYFLVRMRNDCAAGTFGTDSDLAERVYTGCDVVR